ncbi:MAG TPA: diguanylate cyclase [Nitrospiria bacterium]|nr:diguanylate cyclase [Nitrospiria bacterium]
MHAWEQNLANFLHYIRLDHIKRKILVFSLLATLIPSLTMGGLYYVHAKRFLTEKVAQKLRDVTAQNERELDLWIKERLYDARVFANSYVVSENLEKIIRANTAPGTKATALRRLKDYLKSVGNKFVDYEALMVADADARTVATSADRSAPLRLPHDWRNRNNADTPIMGDAYWDPELNKMVMMLAVPIKAQNGGFLGLLAVKLNFHTIDEILGRSSIGNTGKSFLIAPDGTLIAGSRPNAPGRVIVKLPFNVPGPSETDAVLLEYPDDRGRAVIGVLRRMSQLEWGVVTQIGKNEIYAEIVQVRNLTLLISLGLLLAIGLAAYLLGLTIVRPLDRLTNGAARVASGDLEVSLPVVSHGEIGYLTKAFNNMVARLRLGQEELAAINGKLIEKNKELQVLSITDSLTGLFNRKYIMEILTNEVARSRRNKRPFAVMMIDTDQFKKYNDTYGHQAGDDLLKKIGKIFMQSIRNVDYAARYGGDEFIILLPEIGKEGAFEVADRIRGLVNAETPRGAADGVTVSVSIGIAAFPEHGDTPEAIIAAADGALYQSKRDGRNRVVLAGVERQPDIEVTK